MSSRVYPRVCGGTSITVRQACNLTVHGLSPRVRGNHSYRAKFTERWRLSQVYPRVCGGTPDVRALLDTLD